MPVASARQPSQRASAEYRQLSADNASLQSRIAQLRDELRQAMDQRNTQERRLGEAQEELQDLKPPSLDGLHESILAISSKSTFYAIQLTAQTPFNLLLRK